MAVQAVARRLLAAAVLAACGAAQADAPSHFGTVLANGLLCRDQISNTYFFKYMKSYFGEPYKREGGAWWFRSADAQLWGASVAEVMVSDESYPYAFVGAVLDAPPERLEEAIRQQHGFRFAKVEGSERYPVRESGMGSRLVYEGTRSKIYCAKYKPLPLPPALR